ncbi:MAG: 1-(5-phosphoribosyl)-5-[(5-phosphoribosylamino)methylideneamino]imidazole-4-carboxamide isomerase [Alphaproteobacteria bacterium]|nr:1-(5-phosphoribosyl)-5-[(5-phosphoribosylamino)methylideneamino]imidazole-4-carboxamide isomerase [Alphaproteobacteria bacterium]PHY01419.1 MAG: 1-(5-phosphoribosyl)-5-[(5-phosphoribosylamino)methylideneamino]imidazole-4-carboxamide isomerase [Rhodospirillaceae bacterium]
MILFPAIDLKDGRCVRLKQGDMAQATVFNDDPADQAKKFTAAGAQWIHVVDLNGAFAGRPLNALAVTAIIAAAKVPVQLGGGIRDMSTIEAWLKAGIARVILGTVAVKTPQLVRQACKAFAGQIAVGIDARDGMVATEGWAETSNLAVEDLAKRFVDAGVAAIIHTDIDRDGLLGGANVAASAALARAVPIPVIVSGGVSSIEDIKAVKAEAASGLAGVIAGRAIYDGRLDISAAIDVLKG